MAYQEITDDELKRVAARWLEFSVVAMAGLGNNINAVFLGAMLFAEDRPISIRELARLPFIGSRRSAARWAEQLVELGVAEKTEDGIMVTEMGRKTGRYYFGNMSNIRGKDTSAV